MPHKLFVYGTLHPDTAPPEVRADVSRFRLEGKGTIRGKLLDVGDYPGVMLERRGAKEISGHIFSIPHEPELLDRLDRYEEYDANSPATSLFIRKLVNVKLENGTTERCWVYVLNPTRNMQLASAS